MNADTIEVEAIIVVPDVGEYRYIGRSNGGSGSSRRITAALNSVTLSAEARRNPYAYGASMHGDPRYSRGASLREISFEVVDRETFEGEIYENGECRQNGDVTGKMLDQTYVKRASICDVFSGYGGVYVREWHFNEIGNGVPDGERRYLEN